MKIKKLNWIAMNGSNRGSHLATTPVGISYAYWVDEEGVIASIPASIKPPEHKVCSSIQEAKNYCQSDFDRRILESIDDYKFEKWLLEQGNALEKVGLPTLRNIYDSMDEEDK